ncbi:MAG: LamG domain-containing protein [Phycisphaerae bacterium]|nr:LamG domain-containing protein [Phycisphaerae bacterium]
MKTRTYFLCVLLLTAIALPVAEAQEVLKLDVGNSTAAGELEPGYTAFTIADSGKVFNGVTVTVAGTLLARRRTAPTGTGFDQMIMDFIFGNQSNVTFTLAGLEPLTLYDVTIYAWDTSSGSVRNAAWTGNGQPMLQTTFNGSAAPASWADTGHRGQAVSDAQGKLVLVGAQGPSHTSGQHWAFVNALIVSKVDPCFNVAPSLQLESYQTVNLAVDGSIQLNLTATDDGKPYVGGCDPEDPTGNAIGLSYSWTQLSGPATAIIDDATAEDPVISFVEKGVYRFQVSVIDGPLGPEVRDGKESLATVTIRVKDPATDDFLLAHWALEENGGSVVLDGATGYNGAFADTAAADPNWVAGWIEGANPNSALWFGGVVDALGKPVEIAVDPNVTALSDPNFADLQYEITATAWIKADPFTDRQWDTILSHGDHSWRLARVRNTNTVGFFCNRPNLATVRAEGTRNVNDGQWHHVAGTYDGKTIKVYVDGILDVSGVGGGPVALETVPIMIGGNADTAGDGYRTWKGAIDDVRVYTYALSDAEIAALASEGINLVPYINAGPDVTFQMQAGALTLGATLVDDGKPESADVSWSLVQASPPEGQVTFITGTTRLDPTISFSMAGSYLLQITADDGMAESSDTITITVTSPTCADVIADGLAMLGDFTGPAGVPDCKVDLYDLAVFALNWAKCNDPSIPGCDWPY